MPYTQIWEVMDSKGTIHSGNEGEMKVAFDVMSQSHEMNVHYYGKKKAKELEEKYCTNWNGDLRLIQVHEITA